MPDSRERGLYAKYNVQRRDGQPVGQCFVLELKDPNTWAALMKWAETLRMKGYLMLANDVRATVMREIQHAWAADREELDEEDDNDV